MNRGVSEGRRTKYRLVAGFAQLFMASTRNAEPAGAVMPKKLLRLPPYLSLKYLQKRQKKAFAL
jgi:hypothetical protein